MVLFIVVFTFPVSMNSFLISFCPFTSSSSSFRVFTFRVFKEFLRDFRCLLLDLEMRNWEGGMRSWACGCIPGSSCKHMPQALSLQPSAFQNGWLWGNMPPYSTSPLHSKKQRKSWEWPGVHSLRKSPQRKKEWSRGNMEVMRAASWRDNQPAAKCSMKAVLSFHG